MFSILSPDAASATRLNGYRLHGSFWDLKAMRGMDLAELPCPFKIRNVFAPSDFLFRV